MMKSPEMRFSEHVPVIKRHVTVYEIKKYSILQILIEPCYVLSSEHCPPGACVLMTIMKKKENELGRQSTNQVLAFVGQA